MIPTLTTERLVLRAPEMDDFAAYAAFLTTARSAGIGGPLDTKGAWAYFTHDAALWHLVGHGALMMVRRDTGEVAGSLGVSAGPLFDEAELGWMVYDGHSRQGLATEAGAALRDWALGPRALPTLVSYVGVDNAPSRRVAVKLGAVLDGVVRPQGPGTLTYRHVYQGGMA